MSKVRGGIVGLLLGLGASIATTGSLAHAQCVDWSSEFRLPGNGINGSVWAVKSVMMPQGERLLAAGQFTQAGGVGATNIAQWDGTGWSPLGTWTAGGVIRAIEVFDDGTGPAVYVGGNFGPETPGSVSDIAKWDGSQWVAVGGGMRGDVRVMRTFTHQGVPSLFVAGGITEAGGTPTEGVAAWSSAGWTCWTGAPSFSAVSTGYDVPRGRLVVVGTNSSSAGTLCETWTWNGGGWTRAATTGPTRRHLASFANDPASQRLYMMGGLLGHAGEARNTLWAWDGAQWTAISTAPAAMQMYQAYGMAYDAARQRLVVFGGSTPTNPRTNQTWEFDGTTWTQLTPPVSPSGRVRPAMGYDPISQRVMLFGGDAVEGIVGDTWQWDGAAWTLVANTGPAARWNATLAYDPAGGRMVLAEGNAAAAGQGRDVWAWSGTAWVQLAPTQVGPPGSQPVVLDVARNQLVMGAAGWTRGLTGASWQLVRQGAFGPSTSRYCSSFAVHNDGAGARLFAGGDFLSASGEDAGGIAVLDGSTWKRAGAIARSTAEIVGIETGPSAGLWAQGNFPAGAELARWNGTDWVVHAPAGQRLDLGEIFAGDIGSGVQLLASGALSEIAPSPVLRPAVGPEALLAFDGARWSAVQYREPQQRTRAAAAFDPVRRRTVLFGGTTNGSASGSLGDTEEFDGRTWTANLTAGPSARHAHTMAFDAARGKVVLVGGVGISGATDGQTWTLDASGWTLAAPSVGGQARQGHGMAYDPLRQRVVLFGGRDGAGTTRGETWEWDGAAWALVASGGPSARHQAGMVYDPVRGKVLVVGGVSGAGATLSDVWAWDGTQWSSLPGGMGVAAPTVYFDEDIQRVVMIRGDSASELNEAGNWQSHEPGFNIGSLDFRAAAYDSVLNTPVIVGGTWLSETAASVHGFTRVKRQYLESPARRLSEIRGAANFGAGAQRRLFLGAFLRDRPSAGLSAFGEACSPPVIVQPPQGATAVFNQEVTFEVLAAGTQPMSYQWRRNGVPIQNAPGRIDGAQGTRLRFWSWNYGDAGMYDCVATNPLGATTSAAAEFGVENVGPSGPVSLTRIMYPPEPVANDPLMTLTAFSPGLLADSGRILFYSNWSRGAEVGTAVVSWEDGETRLLARTGETPAGIEESSRLTVLQPADISDGTGNALFAGTLTGLFEGAYAKGLWTHDGMSQRLVARQGLGAPGTDCVLADFGPDTFINGAGVIAFSGSLAGGNALPSNAYGIFLWNPTGGTALGVRIGTVLPGSSSPLTAIDGFTLANDGTITMQGREGAVSGYWAGPPGSLVKRVRQGEAAIGLPGTPPILSLTDAASASGGRVCYAAQVQDSPNIMQGLYLSTPSGTTLLAKTGDPVPDVPGATFAQFWPIQLNEPGQLLFSGAISCESCLSSRGLFLREPGGQMRLISMARGTPPPGVSAYFVDAGASGASTINDLGQVVFTAKVGTSSPNIPAVFGWTASTGTFCILAPGQQVLIAEGAYRTVAQALISGPISSMPIVGLSQSLNNQGRVVVTASFSDNTTGLFLGSFGQFLTAAFPCATIALPVSDASVRIGRSVTLRGEGAGDPPLSYRWLRGGVALQDGPRVSGATTPALTINPLQLADEGEYTLEVSNSCRDVATSMAMLRAICPADLDDGSMTGRPDGGVAVDDLLFFLVYFEAGDVRVDLDNGSGLGVSDDAVDVNDLLFFLVRFEAGC